MDKKITGCLLGLLFLFVGGNILSVFLSEVNTEDDIFNNNKGIEENTVDKLKQAGFWNLTGTPIFIDDTDPLYNWSITESTYDWCSGAGTFGNPYIIENVTLDGQGTDRCIDIRNSNVYFRIQNCTLYNGDFFCIYLNNVRNGKIGVNNRISYPEYDGIYLFLCEEIVISENIFTHCPNGIRLSFHSNNTLISKNTLTKNSAIHIDGNDNILLENTIEDYNAYDPCIYVSGWRNNLVGNTLKDIIADYSAIKFEDCYYSDIRDNVIEIEERIKCIWTYWCNFTENFIERSDFYMKECNDNIISKNTFRESSIILEYSDRNHIKENSMKRKGGIVYGISLERSDENEIIDNEILKMYDGGIYLKRSDNNIITGNTISGIGMGGFECIIEDDCEGNEIKDNKCEIDEAPTSSISAGYYFLAAIPVGAAYSLLKGRRSLRKKENHTS